MRRVQFFTVTDPSGASTTTTLHLRENDCFTLSALLRVSDQAQDNRFWRG
jgi:hypothetical protein